MSNNIFDYLKKEINEEKLSHAFLIETNNCEKLMNDLFEILVNEDIVSNQKIENNIAIKLICPENNLIDKNKILELQKFSMTKSVINKYKIYLIINAELMNLSSFNKLLKLLEEPSENVIGFLLTTDLNQIISTIKSRCKRFKYLYETSNDLLSAHLIESLMKIKEIDYSEIIEIKKELLSKDKNDIINVLTEFKEMLIQDLPSKEDIPTIAKYYKILDNIIELIKSNVNLELCIDKMFIEMRK